MNELTAKYRTVFESQIGKDVLADLLKNAHFGETLNWENPGMIAEYNFGVVILASMGIYSRETREDVIRALLTVTPQDKKEG